jgi:hypothetical protein
MPVAVLSQFCGMAAAPSWLDPEVYRLACTPHAPPPMSRASLTQQHTVGQNVMVLLDDVRWNAQATEETMRRLEHELKGKTEEAERLREAPQQQRLRETSESLPRNAGLDRQIDLAKRRIAELTSERQRDRDDKARLLKKVDVALLGGPAATLADVHAVGQRMPAAASSFHGVTSMLPQANVELLDQTAFFKFATMTLNTAKAQSMRGHHIDTERAVLTGLAFTGKELSMTMVLKRMEDEDFATL